MRKLARRGVTKIDVLVSTMLLMAVMSVTATMFHNINLIWKDIRHHRIAAGELANQLDVLTRVDVAEIETAIKELKPSVICSDALPKSTLSAKVVKDAIGNRVDLELQWRARSDTRSQGSANRVLLSGWLKGGNANEQ
jgi:hypothetical protein